MLKTITINTDTHVVVPRVPTLEMISAVDEYVGGHCFSCTPDKASEYDCRRVYDAMISVAPQPEQADAFGLLHNRVHADPGGSRAANVVRSEQPEQAQYSRPVCRGSWALGSACGKCERCEQTKPEQAQQSDLDEALRDAIADVLGDAYDCMRVWSAWGVGTMSMDDFARVADDENRLQDFVDAVKGVYSKQQPAPRPAPTNTVYMCPDHGSGVYVGLPSYPAGCCFVCGKCPAEPDRELSPEFKQAAWAAIKCAGKKVACAKKAGPAEPDGGAV